MTNSVETRESFDSRKKVWVPLVPNSLIVDGYNIRGRGTFEGGSCF